MKRSKQTSINFYFGEVFLSEHYMVAVMNEGMTVTLEVHGELVALAESVFDGRPFGYITHRINSYSVDPKVYLETSKIENLVGFAVVTNKPISESNTEIEQLFLNKPIEVFKSLDEAVDWVNSIIANI